MKHGIAQTYWNGCRCDLCRAAHTRYEKERTIDRALAVERLVSAEFARAELLRLPTKHMVMATGLHLNTIQRIRAGQVKIIRAETERKILRAS